MIGATVNEVIDVHMDIGVDMSYRHYLWMTGHIEDGHGALYGDSAMAPKKVLVYDP